MIKLLSSRSNLVVIAALLCVSEAAGQIIVGAKIGANMNQFSQPGTTVGANAGAYVTYQATPFLTVRFEPHYSQEGGGRPDYYRDYSAISDNISNVTFINPSVMFHNVQIPLLAELSLPEFTEETIKPKLILGGSYGVMIAATETHTKRYEFIEDNGSGSSPSPYPSDDPLTGEPPAMIDVSYQRENVTDNYSRNQWSLWFGFGLDFEAGERSYSFDVRYRQGMSSLNQLRFASPGNSTGSIGTPGTGGKLYSSSLSFNFSMSIFNF